MKKAREQGSRVVLVTGETGSGKYESKNGGCCSLSLILCRLSILDIYSCK
jgi:hypothetical protein